MATDVQQVGSIAKTACVWWGRRSLTATLKRVDFKLHDYTVGRSSKA